MCGIPAAALPVLTYAESMTLRFNGEEIYIYHPSPRTPTAIR
jgi:hypothetical protein